MKSTKVHCFLLIYLLLNTHGIEQSAQKRFLQEGSARCGTSWEDANSKCGTPCPSLTDSECPQGETCFASITCTTSGSGDSSGDAGGLSASGSVGNIISTIFILVLFFLKGATIAELLGKMLTVNVAHLVQV